ncbi:MAG: FliH/SctL family protein [Myxococcota bacterium]
MSEPRRNAAPEPVVFPELGDGAAQPPWMGDAAAPEAPVHTIDWYEPPDDPRLGNVPDPRASEAPNAIARPEPTPEEAREAALEARAQELAAREEALAAGEADLEAAREAFAAEAERFATEAEGERAAGAHALAAAAASFEAAREATQAVLTDDVLGVATALAEAMVGEALARDPAAHRALAEAALAPLTDREGVVLRAGPEAHAALLEACEGPALRTGDGPPIPIVLDDAQGGQGVVVETPEQRLDARVHERLAAARRAMSEGLAEATDAERAEGSRPETAAESGSETETDTGTDTDTDTETETDTDTETETETDTDPDTDTDTDPDPGAGR